MPNIGPPEVVFLIVLIAVLAGLRHLSIKYLSASTRRKVLLGGLFILIPVFLFNRIDTALTHDAVRAQWKETVSSQLRANGLENLVWEETFGGSDNVFFGDLRIQSLGTLSNDITISCTYKRSDQSWYLDSGYSYYVEGSTTLDQTGLESVCPEVINVE